MHVLITDGRAIIQDVRPILDLVGHSTSLLSILILCSESLWSNGLLGDTTPEALMNSTWIMLTLHFGLRGRNEHYKLTFEILKLMETTDWKKYVHFNEKTPKLVLKKLVRAQEHFNLRCGTRHKNIQIDAFELYLRKRPTDCSAANFPSYLAINYDVKSWCFLVQKAEIGG